MANFNTFTKVFFVVLISLFVLVFIQNFNKGINDIGTVIDSVSELLLITFLGLILLGKKWGFYLYIGHYIVTALSLLIWGNFYDIIGALLVKALLVILSLGALALKKDGVSGYQVLGLTGNKKEE